MDISMMNAHAQLSSMRGFRFNPHLRVFVVCVCENL